MSNFSNRLSLFHHHNPLFCLLLPLSCTDPFLINAFSRSPSSFLQNRKGNKKERGNERKDSFLAWGRMSSSSRGCVCDVRERKRERKWREMWECVIRWQLRVTDSQGEKEDKEGKSRIEEEEKKPLLFMPQAETCALNRFGHGKYYLKRLVHPKHPKHLFKSVLLLKFF